MLNIQLRFHPNERSDLVLEKSAYSTQSYIYKGIKYKSISYKLYYDENYAIGCGHCFFPKSYRLGYHPVDKEYIMILLDTITDEPKYCYFSSHRIEGQWKEWKDCKKTNDGALIVYVARSSHANYYKPGIWLRIFGLANDLCSKNGKHQDITNLTYDSDFTFKPDLVHAGLKIRFLLPFYNHL